MENGHTDHSEETRFAQAIQRGHSLRNQLIIAQIEGDNREEARLTRELIIHDMEMDCLA